MDANTKLSEEVVRKTRSLERMKLEAEKCLAQSEKFMNEKTEFESTIYAKFVAVLNSKKAKLRDLRERCLHSKPEIKQVEDEEHGYSEEETDRESDLNNDKDGSASPTHSGLRNAEGMELNNRPVGNTDGVSIASSSKARDNRSENQNSTEEITDPDATQLLEDMEVPKISAGTEPSTSAADLLAVSNYTSAPKKRRRL
eukprot:Gb_22879 [translate_table: standard]